MSEEISAPAHIPDVCGNQRSGTGTSKTGWEAVCRRHVPHRSSYAPASTHSDTSRSRRQTSCTSAVSVSHDPGCGRRDVLRKSPLAGKTFPRHVSATDRGNRSSEVLLNIYTLVKRAKLKRRLPNICEALKKTQLIFSSIY